MPLYGSWMTRRAALLVVLSGFVGAAPGASASTPGHWRLATAQLESASFGVVVMYGPVDCGRRCPDFRSRVFVREAATWREITPPRMVGPVMDVVFLDRSQGRIVANDCAKAKAAVYRTADGGRRWRSSLVGSTGCHAGSRLELVSSDKRRAWILNAHDVVNPPFDFWRSVDGGAAWTDRRTAPIAGSVAAGPSGAVWLGQSDFALPQRLYVTRDDGPTWRRRVLTPPAGWGGARLFPGAPVFFGLRGVLPVTLTRRGRVGVAFYATDDGGSTWRLRSVRAVDFLARPRRLPFVRYVPTSIASPASWWIADGRTRPKLAVSRDRGRSWQVSTPALPRARRWTISAADSEHAWLTTYRQGRAASFTSGDGGRTWERLVLPAS